MGQFKVFQRTKDGFFNATALLKAWNVLSVSERKLELYFQSNKTVEFINTIMERENLHTPKSVYVKSRASRGDNAGTWMSPILFIDFAMWINPSFKYDVLKFVYDQMIAYRNEAGDAYREIAEAVGSIVSKDFMAAAMSKIAKGINYCVFGNHEPLIRNEFGSEAKMRELFQFERKVADLINEGFLSDFESVMSYLRRMWVRMQTPNLLAKA